MRTQETPNATTEGAPPPVDNVEKANLGLATTRELLDEIRARIEVDYSNGGGGLDYTAVGGRP